jgi:hypothetical protein
MENSRPGPDDTDKFSSAKSSNEETAAWLQRNREVERNILFGVSKEKDEDDTEEEGESQEADSEEAKAARRLRLGALPVVLEERSEAPAAAEHGTEEAASEHAAETEENVPEAAEPAAYAEAGQVSAEVPEVSETPVAATETDDIAQWEQQMNEHQASEQESFQQWEEETAQPQTAEQEDFQHWEQEMAEATPTSAETVTIPEEDDEPEQPATAVHGPRARPSSRPARPTTPPPVVSSPVIAGNVPPPLVGGGGNTPPLIPGGPNNPNYNFGPPPPGPNMNMPPISPNMIPLGPNVIPGGLGPNVLSGHEHRHGHPRLALAFAAGLLVEHMLGRRADKKIDTEMRRRTDKLRDQIERSQASQEQARQAMEAQQIRLTTEQDRQRQTLEHRQAAIANVPVGARASQLPQAGIPRQPEAGMPAMPEQVPVINTDTYAEARVRPNLVMEQVAAAAEHDMPVERVYERRQEVRDEPPAGASGAGAAASVGSTLDSSAPSQQYGSMGSSPSAQPHQWDTSAHSPEERAAHYRSAAITGFGAALTLILLGLLAYAVF